VEIRCADVRVQAADGACQCASAIRAKQREGAKLVIQVSRDDTEGMNLALGNAMLFANLVLAAACSFPAFRVPPSRRRGRCGIRFIISASIER